MVGLDSLNSALFVTEVTPSKTAGLGDFEPMMLQKKILRPTNQIKNIKLFCGEANFTSGSTWPIICVCSYFL